MTAEEGYKNRRRAFRRGLVAEYIAAVYLMTKGYRILNVRFRAKTGEVDIVARKGDMIAFVEVKARKTVDDALNAVGGGSQRRIKAASRIWLSKRRDFSLLSWRYDIIAVAPWRLPKHFPDAF